PAVIRRTDRGDLPHRFRHQDTAGEDVREPDLRGVAGAGGHIDPVDRPGLRGMRRAGVVAAARKREKCAMKPNCSEVEDGMSAPASVKVHLDGVSKTYGSFQALA